MNICFLTGNLGKDPEIRTTNSGKTTAKLALATSRRAKNQSGEWSNVTEWHTVILWEGQARFAESFLRKGSKCAVQGRIQTRSWDGPDGKKNYATEIIGHEVEGMDKREQQSGSYDAGGRLPESGGTDLDTEIPF